MEVQRRKLHEVERIRKGSEEDLASVMDMKGWDMEVEWILGKNYATRKSSEKNVQIIIFIKPCVHKVILLLVSFKVNIWFIYLMLPNINTLSIIHIINDFAIWGKLPLNINNEAFCNCKIQNCILNAVWVTYIYWSLFYVYFVFLSLLFF